MSPTAFSSKKVKFNSLLLVTLFSLLISTFAWSEPFTIRFSHIVDNDTPKGQMALKFKELVSERIGDDKAIVKIYPNSTLFDDNEIGKALLNNQVELGAPSLSKLKKYTKRLQLFDIPFLFVSPQAVKSFINSEYGDRMLRLVQRKGLIGLGYLDNGMKQLSANKPISVPKDVTNLRFRIMNSDVLEAQFKQVNANPVKLPFSKVYENLKAGNIDGQENTWSNIYSKKFYEYQPNIIESNHGYLGYMVISSQKFWKSIPEEFKPKIEKSLKEAIDYGNAIALEKVSSDKERIVNAGTSQIHQLTLSERIAWVEAMQPVWKSYEDEIGSELIRAAASAR